MTFLRKHAATITAILSLTGALWGAFAQFVASGQAVTAPALVTVLGAALVGWMAKRPGDLSRAQAEKLAHEHAGNVLAEARASMVPPSRGGD